MKPKLITLFFISSLLFVSLGNLKAQDVEQTLIDEAFPEFQGGLLDENKSKLETKDVGDLRKVLDKINDAINNDLNAFEYDALSKENAIVFSYKSLKKAKKKLDLAKLKQLLLDKKSAIRAYMGDKAQYGADPNECKQHLTLLQQTVKHNKMDAAYKHWHTLFHFYPRSSKMVYSKGAQVVEYMYNKTKDPKWIDTLMFMYDQRIKYKFFGNGKYPKGYILGRKATDILRYNKDEVAKAYPIFKESIELQGDASECAVLLSFMQATEGMFVKGKIDAAEVVDNYTKLNALLEKKKAEKPDDEIVKQALAGVNGLFIQSAASTCEQLVPAFQKRFDKNKDNIEELEKIASMLSMKECTDSDLFSNIAVQMDKLRPSALSKYALAMRFARDKDYEKASDYMNQAINMETTDSLKARDYYKLAQFANAMKQRPQAKKYALQAIELKSNYGAAYILIATMYASSGCSQLVSPEAKLHNVAYWCAVDKLLQAKKVDPSVEDAANELIRKYSGVRINKEDAFMLGVSNGKTVRVGCWINEVTRARL